MKLTAAVLMVLESSTVLGADFYVAPTGNDSNPGSKEKPFATLVRARDAVRALKKQGPLTEPVRVHVAGGCYALNEPLVLTSEDGGTKQAPVVYQALPGERQSGRIGVGGQPGGAGRAGVGWWRLTEGPAAA